MNPKDESLLKQFYPTRRSIGPHSTMEEVQKAYLEAEARHSESLQMIATVFLTAKGYSEKQIQRSGDELIERHRSEIMEDMRSSNGLVYQVHRLVRLERDELKARAK